MTHPLVSKDIVPAYLLVDYAWAVLHANDPGTWDKSKYDGMIPIVSLGEDPEMDEYPGPHIVYGYADNPSGTIPERSRGSVSFVIYDDRFRRLTRTLTTLKVAFEREDQSARDVNRFTTYYDPSGNGDYPYRGIRFGHISMSFLEGGNPEEEEGGRQSAILNVNYEYYVDYDIITDVV